MAQPSAYYPANSITCYPGSNQRDNGKLNLEFNMARLVTRLSSKNFCIVRPSFALSQVTDETTSSTKLQVDVGECSINGMDLIMTSPLTIDPPDTTDTTFYLAFKLKRDSSNNVLGDFIYGVDNTFEGVYLTYFTEKIETDPDRMYLGSLQWDGTNFVDIVEDEDKYGRIWAEDILCKIVDPKHPTVSRLNLQEWMYNVPDWYFSKEGDIIYGTLEMTDGRDGSGESGIIMGCSDADTSTIIVKAPSVDISDLDNITKIQGLDDGTEIHLGASYLGVNEDYDYDLRILSPNQIKVISDTNLYLQGSEATYIGSGGNGDTPTLRLTGHRATFYDDNSNTLKYEIDFSSPSLVKQTIGKAIWQYNESTSDISLLQANVRNLDVTPNSIFRQNTRIVGTLSLGADDVLPQTTLSRTQWVLSENVVSNGKVLTMTPSTVTWVNPTLGTDNLNITLRNTADTIHTKIYDNGIVDLLNGTTQPGITLRDGDARFDTSIKKVLNSKTIAIDGNITNTGNITSSGLVTGTSGLQTSNGTLTFVNGNNNATITKGNGSTTLSTSGGFSVGATGNQALSAGNTTINGTLSAGSSGQFTVNNAGDVNTSGTITATKVFNAVYNDYAEIFEKLEDEEIEVGDVVCIREDGLIHKVSSIQDIDSIIGVCSNTAGVILGGAKIPANKQVCVGLVGQVWVKTPETDIIPGQLVKPNLDGTVSKTMIRQSKIGIALSKVNEFNRVLILFNGF